MAYLCQNCFDRYLPYIIDFPVDSKQPVGLFCQYFSGMTEIITKYTLHHADDGKDRAMAIARMIGPSQYFG